MLISFDSFHQIKLYNFFRTTVVSTYPVCFIMQLRAQVNIRLICIFQVSIDQQTVYCPLKLIIKILILSFFIPLYCICREWKYIRNDRSFRWCQLCTSLYKYRCFPCLIYAFCERLQGIATTIMPKRYVFLLLK